MDEIFKNYQEKAFKYDCLVKKINDKIEELKEIADEDNKEEYIKIQVLQEILKEA